MWTFETHIRKRASSYINVRAVACYAPRRTVECIFINGQINKNFPPSLVHNFQSVLTQHRRLNLSSFPNICPFRRSLSLSLFSISHLLLPPPAIHHLPLSFHALIHSSHSSSCALILSPSLFFFLFVFFPHTLTFYLSVSSLFVSFVLSFCGFSFCGFSLSLALSLLLTLGIDQAALKYALKKAAVCEMNLSILRVQERHHSGGCVCVCKCVDTILF